MLYNLLLLCLYTVIAIRYVYINLCIYNEISNVKQKNSYELWNVDINNIKKTSFSSNLIYK